MWELYTFWAFVPILLITYQNLHPEITFHISLLSFIIIASGSISCVFGGYISQKIGLKKTAFSFLLLSCLCCIVAPFLFQLANKNLFIAFLVFWGMVVIADSPLFSTLVAQNSPSKDKGTALTIVNCIGFSITIISIQIISSLLNFTGSNFVFSILAIGPVFGLLSLKSKVN
jgi:MFS family permease